MKNSKATPWVLGTAFVAVLLLAVAYLFLVSPQLAVAATAKVDTEAAESQNVVHRKRLGQLQRQFEELDTYKAELAALREQIPADDGLPPLLREVDKLAEDEDLFVVAINPGEPVPFLGVPGEPEVAEAEAADGTPAADDATAAPGPAEPEEVTLPGFVAIPFEVTVLGEYEDTVAFIEAMQTKLSRTFLVSGYTFEGQAEAEASGGRPATKEGDVETRVRGFVYVLQETQPGDVTETTDDAAGS